MREEIRGNYCKIRFIILLNFSMSWSKILKHIDIEDRE